MPLLDNKTKAEIIWVGLSAKQKLYKTETPLSPDTKSGLLLREIEKQIKDIPTYKTNFVKCLPLDDKHKLRYPTSKEMSDCFGNFKREIEILNPKIILLLGKKVHSAFEKNFNISLLKWDNFDYKYLSHKGKYYIPIHHPSYIYVYKKKCINSYISGVVEIIKQAYSKM